MYVLIKDTNNYPEIEHEVVKRGYVLHIRQRDEGKKSVKKKRRRHHPTRRWVVVEEQIHSTTDSEDYWLDTRRKQKITLD